ncbi:MAG: hypothetical protein COC00_007030 [Rhizobiales bacterium]|nr:hypothetical protein [Hyphomicrobiales bacterium]
MNNKNKSKLTIIAGLTTALISTSALAGGLERQTYSADILFAKGTRIEAAFATVKPDVTGDAVPGFYSGENINPKYDLRNFGFKFDVGDKLALAFTAYTPLGYTLAYPGPKLITSADVKSQAYALSAKYMVKENIAVFGSAIHVKLSATANLIPDPDVASTYNLNMKVKSDSDWGYVIGAAYLKPEIAMRIALSYETGTEHTMSTDLVEYDTTAPLATAFTPKNVLSKSGTASAIALNFQTGIAANTLLFGSIRHAYNSGANLLLNGKALTDFSDLTTYKLGVGRKLNDLVSVSVSGLYEHGSGTASTLNPTDGKFTLSGGAKFQLNEHLDLTTGVSYTWLGDNNTKILPIGSAIAFKDNNALAFGAKIGFSF